MIQTFSQSDRNFWWFSGVHRSLFFCYCSYQRIWRSSASGWSWYFSKWNSEWMLGYLLFFHSWEMDGRKTCCTLRKKWIPVDDPKSRFPETWLHIYYLIEIFEKFLRVVIIRRTLAWAPAGKGAVAFSEILSEKYV